MHLGSKKAGLGLPPDEHLTGVAAFCMLCPLRVIRLVIPSFAPVVGSITARMLFNEMAGTEVARSHTPKGRVAKGRVATSNASLWLSETSTRYGLVHRSVVFYKLCKECGLECGVWPVDTKSCTGLFAVIKHTADCTVLELLQGALVTV